MHAFIVDELMFAMAQEVREQAMLARPHASRRAARRASLQPRPGEAAVRVVRNPDARTKRPRRARRCR
jgi:hypothetical protein